MSVIQPSILSISTQVPGEPVTTTEMIEKLSWHASNELIETIKHLGIEQRYSVIDNFLDFLNAKAERKLMSSSTDLAAKAIKKCFDQSNLKIDDLGMLIAVTNTPNRPMPGLVYEIVAEFDDENWKKLVLLNMQDQGCSALVKAIEMAGFYLQANPDKKAMIVTVEAHTLYMSQLDTDKYLGFHESHQLSIEDTSHTEKFVEDFLFGDGAVAMLLGLDDKGVKLGSFSHLTNIRNDDKELLTMNEGGGLVPEHQGYPNYRMNPGVPIRGSIYAKKCLASSLEKAKLDGFDTLSAHLIHTGSKKILDGVCKILHIDQEVPENHIAYEVLQKYGNLSSGSIGFMLADFINKPHEDHGFGALVSFGVGFSASSAVFSY